MGLSKDGRVLRRDLPPSFTIHRPRHNGRPATGLAVLDELINELDEVVRKPNGDLLTHTKMVPLRDASLPTSRARHAHGDLLGNLRSTLDSEILSENGSGA